VKAAKITGAFSLAFSRRPEFEEDRDGARIIICAWRARDGVIVSADNVIGRSLIGCRKRGKQIRHPLVVVVIILLSYDETSLLKDRVNIIRSSH
jgi:hypothetical protein